MYRYYRDRVFAMSIVFEIWKLNLSLSVRKTTNGPCNDFGKGNSFGSKSFHYLYRWVRWCSAYIRLTKILHRFFFIFISQISVIAHPLHVHLYHPYIYFFSFCFALMVCLQFSHLRLCFPFLYTFVPLKLCVRIISPFYLCLSLSVCVCVSVCLLLYS